MCLFRCFRHACLLHGPGLVGLSQCQGLHVLHQLGVGRQIQLAGLEPLDKCLPQLLLPSLGQVLFLQPLDFILGTGDKVQVFCLLEVKADF